MLFILYFHVCLHMYSSFFLHLVLFRLQKQFELSHVFHSSKLHRHCSKAKRNPKYYKCDWKLLLRNCSRAFIPLPAAKCRKIDEWLYESSFYNLLESDTFWNPWPNVNVVLYYELWEPNLKYWHWVKWAWMFCPLVLENKYIKTNKRTQGIRDYCWKTWSFSNRGILPTRTKLDPKWKQPNHINISHKWFSVLHTVMHSEITTHTVNWAKATGNMQSDKSCQNIKSLKIFPC